MSAIWWGDLATAVRRLSATRVLEPEDVAKIRAMLGMSRVDGADRLPSDETPPHPEPPHRDQRGEAAEVASIPPDTAPPTPAPLARPPRSAEALSVELTASTSVSPPDPWRDAAPLPTLADLPPRDDPHTPLLRPGAEYGVLQAAVSRPVHDGEVDIARLVTRLATGKPVDRLPRRRRWTLRFGVQLLVDHSSAMTLYEQDTWALAARLDRLLGAGTLSRWDFDGSPWTDLDDRPYKVPSVGSVLILSSFGIHPACPPTHSVPAWTKLIDTLHRNEIRAVAMIPFPRHRVPGWLTDLVPVIPWDRTTTVATVRAAMDGGRTR
ncbi:hypothetical protein [Actinokineospora sp. HUAS TT18]|uniref:hypothetical protein n=1 Tax=Actinokineospora sp. HUAS TT18 TaxID=3447451 RepID=UPI003F51FF45